MDDIFSTREIATGIWLSVLVIYAASSDPVRRSFGRLLQILFKRQILFTFLIIISYVAGEVWLLNKIGAWDRSLLKETSLWFLFSAVALFFEMVANADKEEIRFKKLLKETLGGLVILEFLLSFYTFSLLVELILVPMAAFLTVAMYMSETNPEEAPAVKVFRNLLIALGIFAVVHSIREAVSDPSIFSISAARQLFVPAALTILFIPALYIFSLYSIYSSMFCRISFALKNSAHWKKHAKWQAFKIGNFGLGRTRRLSKVVARKIWSAASLEEIDYIFDEFRRPIVIQPNDWIALKTTGETAKVESVNGDFAIVRFQDGDEEMWAGDLKVIRPEG